LEIRVEGRDIEKALRILKREVQKSGLLKELKKRRHYNKPSVRKKIKQAEARKRLSRSKKKRRY